jgi:hypothetical protein
MYPSGSIFSVVYSYGGNPGTDSTSASPGSGGTGGTNSVDTFVGCMGGNGGTYNSNTSSTKQGTSGVDSVLFPIYPNTLYSYNFGGGGGGGVVKDTLPTPVIRYPAGGLGGGGSGTLGYGNNATIYSGPSSIYYNVTDVILTGYPGVGGRSWWEGTSPTGGDNIGGQGGSGVVILCYKTLNP